MIDVFFYLLPPLVAVYAPVQAAGKVKVQVQLDVELPKVVAVVDPL